jgi:Myb/SANT-like DNA-binding domain
MATDTPMHLSDRQIAYPKVQIIIGAHPSPQTKTAKTRGANAKWSKAEVDSFIDQLFQANEDGNTAEGGFKSTIWGGIADSFVDPLKKARACESKWTRLKKDYKEIRWRGGLWIWVE